MNLREFDVEVEGIPVHGWEGGSGFPLLLLHGSGPGASTLGNWRLVIGELAARYHVIATDLIGFGLSGRKKQEPFFDPDLWLYQALQMLDRFQADSVGILGHSLSGALALKAAGLDSRIKKVLTTGTMGAAFTVNAATELVWTFPEGRQAIRRVGEAIVYDKSLITDTYIKGRVAVLSAPGYEDYFSRMFAGDKQRYADAVLLSDEELARVRCDVALIHGRDDVAFPSSVSQAIAGKLLQADVHLLAHCSHSPALEHPEKLISIARSFFG